MANIKGLRSCVTVKDYSVLKKNTNKAKAEKEKLRKTRKAEIEREKQIKAVAISLFIWGCKGFDGDWKPW